MKHAGQILKDHIEKNGLVKGDIAKAVGISYNYLSTLFKKASFDTELLEKLYVAAGLHPAVVFDVPEKIQKNYSDIEAQAFLGTAMVNIGQNENMRELLDAKDRIIEEKERIIQLLMANANSAVPGQKRDNDNK